MITHTQQFFLDEKQNSPNLFKRNYRDSLGEFSNTVKSHFKALGLYNFKRVLGGLINGGGGGGGLYPGGFISGIKKRFRNNKIKHI